MLKAKGCCDAVCAEAQPEQRGRLILLHFSDDALQLQLLTFQPKLSQRSTPWELKRCKAMPVLGPQIQPALPKTHFATGIACHDETDAWPDA